MAPRQNSDTSRRYDDIPAKEIVFSCGVCQRLISDVYATKESDHGFNSSSDHDEGGVVVKFWMADCSHTFCGKHLEGGGPPFYRQGHQPSAPCPVCIAISPTRTSPRELFDIRGLQEGEYADEIPALYLKCPPGDLSGVSPEMDAYRFQYSQMIRYSKAVTTHWRSEQRKRRVLESTFAKERKGWRKHEAGVKDRIAALEKAEAKLKKWEQRREMINHYLGLVGKMGEDINRMRSQLAQVGLHVPDGHYAFESSKSDAYNEQRSHAHVQSKSCADGAATLVGDQQHRSSSSRKRRQSFHEEYGDDKKNQFQSTTRRNSRELMPPPLPRPRQPSQPRYVLEATRDRPVAPTLVELPRGMHCTTRNVRQELGALPFRQRPGPYYVDDVDARYQLPAISAPAPGSELPPQSSRPPNQNFQPSAAYVASPFFKSDTCMRPDTMQRPRARGTIAPPYSVPPSRSLVTPGRSASFAQRDRTELAPRQPIPSHRQSSLAPPSFRVNSAASRYQPALQSTYQRAELPPAAASYAPNRSASLAQRDRMKLHSSRVPTRSSFDPQLSTIRGIRGANSSQITYSRQGLSSSQPTPRSTSSAAGARRIVLR